MRERFDWVGWVFVAALVYAATIAIATLHIWSVP